eukprot:gene7995-8854_t
MDGDIAGSKHDGLLHNHIAIQCHASDIKSALDSALECADGNKMPASLSECLENNKENATDKDCKCSNTVTKFKESEKSQVGRIPSKRKRRSVTVSSVCPVCGITLRPGEIYEHYEREIKLLNDLNDPSSKSSVKWLKRLNSKKGKTQGNSKDNSEHDNEKQTSAENSKKREEEFLNIKKSRLLRHAKFLLATAPQIVRLEESSSDYRMINCPVCDAPVAGDEDELTHHINRCLNKKVCGETDEIAVSEEESIEEYTWAGQTRIRATSLLEGGLVSCEGDAVKVQMTNEDEELDIDGDSQIQYGLPQDQGSSNSKEHSRSRWSDENGNCSSQGHEIEGKESLQSDCGNGNQEATIKDLEQKLANMADELQKEKLKCLICMEGFNTPLVSIVCWHVYCEECWMRTLGAKKLCPQCNTITSPSDLRRIFI